jgi:hypothetical protein
MPNGKPEFIRKELQRWFSRSHLKEKLMATIWHPKNIDKFRHMDPDLFAGLYEDVEEEDVDNENC